MAEVSRLVSNNDDVSKIIGAGGSSVGVGVWTVGVGEPIGVERVADTCSS